MEIEHGKQAANSESPELWNSGDDEAEIRYSLTALGEAVLGEGERSERPRFFGFGPCVAVA